MDEKRLTLLDFANPQPETTCPFAQFTHSWSDASSYLVIINNLRRYQPRPLSLENVPVEDELMELREAIAENAHEVWAAARVEEGWTYGEERNDQLMHNPDIVPYNILPESEKEYDRMMAINTIKLIKKLGWKLVKNDKPSTQE
ncbi:MAG: Ryanodine receptor Ryr [Prevotella sp.]|nr:Ryanodine receptor Ryr [Prevotella sp.]